jgi:hypothetical protein
MKRILVAVLVLSFASSAARAELSREFLMSCIYGTLAGTIVGAASLATADKPSEKLQRIARGASLGLYAGILLGLYVVYAVPDENEQLNEVLSQNTTIKPFVYPIFSEGMKLEGAGINITVLNF